MSRQKISYDQLSLTQFVQGFVRNILDESDQNYREQMLIIYLICWKIGQISLGVMQKLLMQYYYAKCKGVS